MNTNLRYAQKATRRYIRQLKQYEEILIEESKVSDYPQVSFCYSVCRSLVLIDENQMGLSHLGPADSPLYHLDKMLKKMSPNPTAVAIAGIYPQDLLEACQARGIEVADYFVEKSPRDIITLPSNREILVFASSGKYLLPRQHGFKNRFSQLIRLYQKY